MTGMKVIRSRLIIDGTGKEPIKNGVILIENDKIKQIGTETEVDIPKDVEIIDLNDQVVLPGLIDDHRHFLPMDERPFYVKVNDPDVYKAFWAARIVRHDLGKGVTTIRLLGQHGWWTFAFRKAIEEDLITGPRILNAGVGIRSPHGHGYLGEPFTGVDNIRRAIRKNFLMGADCTKIYITGGGSSGEINIPASYLSKEEIEAAIDETHRVGLKIAAHCYGGIGGTWFIEAGGDSLEHGSGITEEQMDLMIKNGTYLSMTLPGRFAPDVKQINESMRAWIQKDKKIQAAVAERKRRKITEPREQIIERFKKAIKKGVKFTTHQDLQYGNLPWNIVSLVKIYDVSPMDAILANTKNGAECCGILDRIGTLEPGKYADIISVEGNPLEDIMNIQKTGMVMKGGRIFDPTTGYWKSLEPIEQIRLFSY